MFAEIRPEPTYITLVEALSLDGFKITEVSEGGSVPSLRVINETPQHVLLFDGEELKGAKQNRILNTTILIAAGSALDVPVSCTARGRWSYQSAEFSSSGSLAPAEVRKHKAAAVACSLEVHASPVSDQGAVWSEIEQLHLAAKSDESSKTRAMKDAYDGRQLEIDEFIRGIPLHDGQCGLLAAIGESHLVDVYHAMFGAVLFCFQSWLFAPLRISTRDFKSAAGKLDNAANARQMRSGFIWVKSTLRTNQMLAKPARGKYRTLRHPSKNAHLRHRTGIVSRRHLRAPQAGRGERRVTPGSAQPGRKPGHAPAAKRVEGTVHGGLLVRTGPPLCGLDWLKSGFHGTLMIWLQSSERNG